MAYMMPIMKKNYTLYNPGTGTNHQPHRKTSDHTDGRKLRGNRAHVRSAVGMGSTNHQQFVASAEALHGHGNTLAVGGMRSRGSAPTFSNAGQHLVKEKEKSRLHHTNSVPVGGRSKLAKTMVNPQLVVESASTSSLSSTSTSSSSSSQSVKAIGKFHHRLISRLRKTLGFGAKPAVQTSP